MQRLVEGFTKEEADFMDRVPLGLAKNLMLEEYASAYNYLFHTDLTTRQFHDRFDDYMKEMARDDSEEEAPAGESPEDIVDQYFKEIDGPNVDKLMAYCSYPILVKYEKWRQERDRKSLEEYADLMNLADRLMGSYNTIMDSINTIMDSIGKVFQ